MMKVMKTKIIICTIILLISFTSAYTPTISLCYDENGRGIMCEDIGTWGIGFLDKDSIQYSWNNGNGIILGMIDEYAIWNRSFYLSENDKIIFAGLCYTNERGHSCLK